MRLHCQPGVFLRRYQRFLADCQLADGTEITAHCPNSGSMRTLLNPGVPAWLTHHDNPKRKLPWTLTLLGLPAGGLALVDTMLPNRIATEAIRRQRIPELSGYQTVRTEVSYGSERSRIDILLQHPDRTPCWVEVKNNTMASDTMPGRSDFPDAVTVRGTKHLRELAERARAGERAVLLLMVNRSDCRSCGIAEMIDTAYAAALRSAMADGIEVLCYRSRLTRRSITLAQRCPFDFS